MKTAIVIGATGLVGSELVQQLFTDSTVDKVIVFVRSATGWQHAKLQEHVVDFDKIGEWKQLIQGDVLFSALGTTLKKAGSKEKQFTIDYTYQYETAVAAAANGVQTYILISAAYAKPDAKIFYSRIKGQLEEAVKRLRFTAIYILKPGMLDGNRKENRLGEKLGIAAVKLMAHLPGLSRFKPIHASIVARAMIQAAKQSTSGIQVYELEKLFMLAN